MIERDSQLFWDYFACKICHDTVDYDNEWVCTNCNVLVCLKCITQCLSQKMECIQRCHQDGAQQNAGNALGGGARAQPVEDCSRLVQFARPPTSLLALYQSAQIRCEVCANIYSGTNNFKKHICNKIDKDNTNKSSKDCMGDKEMAAAKKGPMSSEQIRKLSAQIARLEQKADEIEE